MLQNEVFSPFARFTEILSYRTPQGYLDKISVKPSRTFGEKPLNVLQHNPDQPLAMLEHKNIFYYFPLIKLNGLIFEHLIIFMPFAC